MKKIIWTLGGIALGLILLIASVYLYLYSEKTIFKSPDIKFDSPYLSLSRTLNLKEDEDPHKFLLNVNINVMENKNQDLKLFSYTISVENTANQVIEKKSSFFTYSSLNNAKAQNKKEINLLTLNDVPTGSYFFNLTIKPENKLPKSIKLNKFSYMVKSQTNIINWPLSIGGVLAMLLSIILLRKELRSLRNQSNTASDTDKL